MHLQHTDIVLVKMFSRRLFANNNNKVIITFTLTFIDMTQDVLTLGLRATFGAVLVPHGTSCTFLKCTLLAFLYPNSQT